ncbi:hypothetical protein WJX81_000772 [Elliptochloris bilobata]|uniref:PPM-type phosphatase domain-containing protein n=1 Tax=Elliptochloris bilobata TaxID=381761 RepID=A0AAW1SBT6_9CHLO
MVFALAHCRKKARAHLASTEGCDIKLKARVGRASWQAARAAAWEGLAGLGVRWGLARERKLGEDASCQHAANTWAHAGLAGSAETPFAAFGVFDGHGGKFAAAHAAKQLLEHVMSAVDRGPPDLPAPDPMGGSPADGAAEGSGLISSGASTHGPAQGAPDAGRAAASAGVPREATGSTRTLWRLQDELLRRLPQACVEGFAEADCEISRRAGGHGGGTTAVVAVAVGWELLVASVGDSLAVLDTGSEVLQVSGNHRLDDNAAEAQRICDAGGEVTREFREGGPKGGTLRTQPLGLANARSLGDATNPHVLALPEVQRVALPPTGGRLVLASDGLWDAVSVKDVCHFAKGMPAPAAAAQMLKLAVKRCGRADDVTVVVVDLLPSDDRLAALPPLLGRKQERGNQEAEPLLVWRPLEAPAPLAAPASEASNASSDEEDGSEEPGAEQARSKRLCACREAALYAAAKRAAAAREQAAAEEAARIAIMAAEAEAAAAAAAEARQMDALKRRAALVARRAARGGRGRGRGPPSPGRGEGWETVPAGRVTAARPAPPPAAARPRRAAPPIKLAAMRWAPEELFEEEEENGLAGSDSGTFTDAASSASARARDSGYGGGTEEEWMQPRSECSADSEAEPNPIPKPVPSLTAGEVGGGGGGAAAAPAATWSPDPIGR